MKIFKFFQKRIVDNQTMINKSISSTELMENAAINLTDKIFEKFGNRNFLFKFFVGTGNNGGDGLAMARLFHQKNENVFVYFCEFSSQISDDCKINLEKFKKIAPDSIKIIKNCDDINFNSNEIIIDCLFGSGLNRATDGEFKKVIRKINDSDNYVISIDIPSGLFGEDNGNNFGEIIRADKTLSIQLPPISAMFAENEQYYGNIEIVDIGLCDIAINDTASDFYIIDDSVIKVCFRKRQRFEHKGNFGHALLIAGSYGKAGAAVLAARACMKSGVGLLTVGVPENISGIIQNSVPEAMLNVYNWKNREYFKKYSAIGIGPGIINDSCNVDDYCDVFSNHFFSVSHCNLVFDADALNIISRIDKFDEKLPKGTILTPHPKEFERLFGKFNNSWERLEFMQKFSKRTGVIIVLKGGITTISLPDRRIFFNSKGNPGMATAGSGDVLTGIITALLAQQYTSEQAAIIGVYIHALAGDFAKETVGETALIASDIVDNLCCAFKLFE